MTRDFRGVLDLGLALALGSTLLASPGCGSGQTPAAIDPKDQAERTEQAPLLQLADVVRVITEEKGAPPGSLADVTRLEKLYPQGIGELKRGEIIMSYGVLLQDGVTDRVLAYEKETPEKGGHVLMVDGKTVKKMTPEEFKAIRDVK